MKEMVIFEDQSKKEKKEKINAARVTYYCWLPGVSMF